MAHLLTSTTPAALADTNDYASFSRPGIVSLIVSMIAMPVMLFLFVRFLRTAKSKKVTFKRSDQIMALSTFILYLAYSCHVMTESLYVVLHSGDFNPTACILYYTRGQWLGLGKLSAYLFFLCRLYHTFAGSMFAISYRTAMIAAISMILTFVLCTGGFAFATFFGFRYIARLGAGHDQDNAFNFRSFEDCSLVLQHEVPHYQQIMATAVGLNALWDMVVSVWILRTFVTKLTLLSIAFREIDGWVQKNATKTSKKNQRRQQKKQQKNAFFLSLTIRTTNIVILSTVSAYFGLFVLGARIGEYWLMLDQITRLIAISMMYSKELYARICCCDTCCYSCCTQLCYCCCLKPHELPQHVQLEINQNCNVDSTSKADLGSIEMPSTPTRAVTILSMEDADFDSNASGADLKDIGQSTSGDREVDIESVIYKGAFN